MERKPGYQLINGVPTFFWNPQADYPSGVEIISIPHLVRRGTVRAPGMRIRLEFFMLLAVNYGQAHYSVDFEKTLMRCGSWLLVQPGQMMEAERLEDLDGWAINFRPDFLPSGESRNQSPFHTLSGSLADFPTWVQLEEEPHMQCCAIVESLLNDLQAEMDDTERNGLLLFQLCTLLMRLLVFHHNGAQNDPLLPTQEAVRMAKLRKLVEQYFKLHHHCQWYAEKLGCSVKTLGRTTLAMTGKSTKAFLTERIMLEAKRQLIHSRRPVQTIAAELGFDEYSNFVKFFRKETGTTPKGFREQWLGAAESGALAAAL